MTSERVLFHDIESFSEVPIKHGVHRYKVGAEIMVHAWAIDDPLWGEGPVRVWDATEGGPMPDELRDALADPTIPIVGHNYGNFDRHMMAECEGIVIEPERIIDTMVQALSHGLPGGLGYLCDIFSVPIDLAKDKDGKSLIQLFCKPRPKSMKLRRATRFTHPAEWQRFLEYAASDISSMRYLRRHMPSWNYPGRDRGNRLAPERELWCLDQRINDRGFAVDVELAERAIEAVDGLQAGFRSETVRLTDGSVVSPMQRDKLLEHLLMQYGVSLPDMAASTIERRLQDEDLPEPVRDLLRIRLAASTSSTTKFKALLGAVGEDDRLRGSLQFCGAARTGRDAGRIFQPQNLMRPTMKQDAIDEAIDAIKAGCLDLVSDDPMQAVANTMRGVITAGAGRKLVQVDLQAIEARVLPWLAGEQWKLDAFRRFDAGEGPDLYSVTATRILGRHIAKSDPERQSHGKVPELACGYGGAVGAFHSMAKIYNIDLTDAEAKAIVADWRAANPAIADWNDGFWNALDTAARQAIQNPGQTFDAGRYIRFHRQGEWLRMRLPSGRLLVYARPQIVPDPRWPNKTAIRYWGLNNYSRRMEWRYTYGGKLSADATQATARDILFYHMPAVEEAGYPITLRVHDEFLTEPLDDRNQTVDRLIRIVTAKHDWIDDRLPLNAGGFEAMRYRKD